MKSLFIALLLIMASCKVDRNVQKSTFRTDSTAISSKEVAKGTTTLQQNKNSRLDSSHANGQNKYQRQTVSYQFAPDTGRNKGNGIGLFPPVLENRLTGITVTTEQGTQDMQTGSLTRQNSDGLSIAKDSTKSAEKKSVILNTTQAAKHTNKSSRGSWWWLILLIAVIVLVIRKRKQILTAAKKVLLNVLI